MKNVYTTAPGSKVRNQWIIYAYVSLAVSWLIVSLIKLFPSILLEIYELASAEEYSYLYALILVIMFTFIKRIKTIEPPSTSSVIYGIIVSSLGLSSSLYLYSISFGVAEWYWVRIIALSFWIIGVTILALGLDNASKLKIPLLSLFLLIPVPRTIIDSTAITLSKILGRIAAPLVGAKISESTTGLTILSVIGPQGRPIHFEIAVGCSGIVSLTSIIAVLPIIADILSSTKAIFRRKIYALIMSTITLAAILLFGNLLRIIGILVIAKYMGQQAAMEFFHSTPSIIFAIIASIIIVVILRKILKENMFKDKRGTRDITSTHNLGRNIVKFIILAIIFVGIISFTSSLDITEILNVSTQLHVQGRELTSVDTLFSNFTVYFPKNIGLEFKGFLERKNWEQLLGIPLVLVSYLRYENKGLTLYIEGSGSPHLFHNWPVCLAYQGFTIERSWIDNIKINNKSIDITYIVYRRGAATYLMGYARFSILADYGGISSPVYYKITFLSSTSTRGEKDILEYYNVIEEAFKKYLSYIDDHLDIIYESNENPKHYFFAINPILLTFISSFTINTMLLLMAIVRVVKESIVKIHKRITRGG